MKLASRRASERDSMWLPLYARFRWSPSAALGLVLVLTALHKGNDKRTRIAACAFARPALRSVLEGVVTIGKLMLERALGC
jgi:hypothetical protein